MPKSYDRGPRASTQNDHAAIAHELLDRGFRPVIIYPRGFDLGRRGPAAGKEPFGTAWGTKPISKQTLAQDVRHFTARGCTPGVGICLGPDRAPGGGWLIDVEGDGPEAEASRARLFGGEIVETAGWPSTRGNHQLLTCDGARLKEIVARLKPYQAKGANQSGVFHIPSLPGLELRIGGYKPTGVIKQVQSVCPPTPGTDGTPRRWNAVQAVGEVPQAFYRVLAEIADGATRLPAEQYLRTALENAIRRIEAAQPGARRERYRDEAYCLAGYLHYGIGFDEQELFRSLTAARAVGVGPDDPVAVDAVREAIAAGKAAPRDLKAELHQAATAGRIRFPAEPSPNGNGRHTPPPPATEAEDDAIRPHEAEDDPHRLARLHLDWHGRRAGALTLRYWQGEFHRWDVAYRPMLDKEVNAALAATCKTEFDRLNVVEVSHWRDRGKTDAKGNACPAPTARKVSRALVGNVSQALGGYTLLDSGTKQPSWLAEREPFPADEVLPTRNALVHLPGFVEGRKAQAIIKPTPEFFSPYALDYDFDPAAPEPAEWLTFLGARPVTEESRVKLQLWPDEPECVGTLQEWFGHLLVPDTSHQKILGLIGPKRCGKGTIARILRALIGPENVANPTLSGLGTQFGLAPLVGKLAAVITDARLSGRSDIAQVVETLLSVSGEDARTIDRKHLPSVTTNLTVRFTLISNETPRLADASGALAGRMIILPLKRSFYGMEDRGLTATLTAELPGILLWAIEGWRRLRERGHFAQPKAGKELVAEMEDLGSPVGAFVKERCVVGPEHEVLIPDLYGAWKDWCASKGRENPGDEQRFGRDLRAVLPALKIIQPRRDGTRQRFYQGLDLAVDF